MDDRRTKRRIAAVFFLLLGICLSPQGPVQGAEARRQTIFAPQARYSVEITAIDGNDYVNLFEVLEPLRKVDAHADGKAWKLTIAGTPAVELRFHDKKRKFTLGGGTLELPANFRLIAEHGYVPVSSLDWLLTQITGLNSEMHAATHRLFLGGVATRINPDLRKSPSRLVLTFPFAVNPEIVTEGNALRLTFSREPVVSSGTDNLAFNDPVINSATFSETARGAEFVVKGSGPLTLSLADSGRTVIITGPQAPAPAPTVAQSPAPAAPGNTNEQKPAAVAPTQPGQRPFVVAVDAGHGGGDTGAIFSDRLLEKDITLAIARRLVHELQSRGVPAMLVRNSDTQMMPDQRAVIANTAALSRVYISIHAAASGSGVRIYRAMIAPAKSVEHAFVPWQTAQAGWLDRSAELAGAIAAECSRRQFASRSTSAPLPALNNIAGPAVAVEVAPPSDNVIDIGSAEYQQTVAAALANAIAAVQPPQRSGGAQ
jgi:N-acetylmuramoyl-L-alanine amidase